MSLLVPSVLNYTPSAKCDLMVWNWGWKSKTKVMESGRLPVLSRRDVKFTADSHGAVPNKSAVFYTLPQERIYFRTGRGISYYVCSKFRKHSLAAREASPSTTSGLKQSRGLSEPRSPSC